MCTCVGVYVGVSVYMFVHVHVCMYTSVCMYVCVGVLSLDNNHCNVHRLTGDLPEQ